MATAVLERERVADACQGVEGCLGEVEWRWRPSPTRPDTYLFCDYCKRVFFKRNPGPGEFVRIGEGRT